MMIGVKCNEDTHYPSPKMSLQNHGTGNINNNYTSDEELVDQVICSDNITSEVGYAAQTLFRMANDKPFSSTKGGFECGSLSLNGKGFRDFDGVVRKVGCLSNDECRLLSNSLDAFSGRKQRRKFESSTHFGVYCSDEGDGDTRTSDRMLYRKCRNKIESGGDLITLTGNKPFSFSIIHLMSSVRLALVGTGCYGPISFAKFGGNDADRKGNFLNFDHQQGLSVGDIVEQVRLRPGDTRILHSDARLVDLVRGVLLIFASETLPSGVKGWRQLVVYDKFRKGWSWIGPVPCLTSEQGDDLAVCATKVWGLSKRVLVKMVDCFADWLKNNLNALKQRANLPLPPLSMSLCKINFKKRFSSHLRGKGCSPTITPSIGEIRAYFRAEERVRYMIPDRAYAYTAADGRKSSVAPVRKCVSARARDHSLLKWDRPTSITILAVVRDAAARLPGGMGTRGDVAVLVRDSQYLVEGISDEQMSQVVSGGLDRLHYERDPCVRFDRQRRLWVYLHGDREEDDFDDAGRQSTITRWTTKLK